MFQPDNKKTFAPVAAAQTVPVGPPQPTPAPEDVTPHVPQLMADKWAAYEREDLDRELIPGMIQAEALTLIGLRLSDIAHSLDGLKNVGRSISSALTLKDCGPSEKADNLIDEMRNPAHAASWWRQVQKILSNLDSADEKHQRDLSAMKLQSLAGSGPAPLQYGGKE